ncbi:MAG: hypothetical protein AB1648_10135 [Pseudomonadota bacterium]
MAKTPAQRQAAYRSRRHNGEGIQRLNTWISTPAFCALQRLVRHHGLSQRALIEQILFRIDDEAIRTLEMGTPEWDRYFGVTR